MTSIKERKKEIEKVLNQRKLLEVKITQKEKELKETFYQFKDKFRLKGKQIVQIPNPDYVSFKEFEKLFSEYIGSKHGVAVNSCTSALEIVLKAIGISDGDEVIVPAPYWVSYFEIIKLSGGVPVEVPTSIDTDFKITAEQLEKAITPKTKMVWYSSPCNPSGSVYSREELTALAKVLEKHPNIYVVSDEIYEHINFSGTFCSIASIPGMLEKTITVNGVAKAFAMTGWRIGYIGAPEFIAKACTKIQGQVTSGANSIAQRATIAAVEADPKVLNYMVEAFHKRRDLVVGLIKEIPGLKINVPEGAFYVFPDVSSYFGKTLNGTKIENATDFSMYLLAEANVATVTGEAFGNPDCIRFSYATSEELLTEAMRRIKQALA